jgi:tartrate dehydratase alpha subunit/fumarate hydratase class I-like protein
MPQEVYIPMAMESPESIAEAALRKAQDTGSPVLVTSVGIEIEPSMTEDQAAEAIRNAFRRS